MRYDPDIHHRRSIRLRGYEYCTAGAYFVTICTQGRECLFGDIADEETHLKDSGRMVREWWLKLPDKFPGVALDEYVIMPNHFHGIVVINDVGATPCGRPDVPTPCGRPDVNVPTNTGRPHGAAPTLGNIIDWFKTMSTNAYIHGVKQFGWPSFPGRLWQRNFYERVIRDEAELAAIRKYIQSNPATWADDEERPESV